MPVKYEDLVLAFDFVSVGGVGEHQVFLDRQSGNIHWHSHVGDNEEELPEDIDDGDKYVEIPHKKELDLGQRLVFNFVRRFLPDDYDDVRGFFSRRGAYARFNDLLRRKGVLKQWDEFEAKAQERALREWCEQNGIEVEG